MKKSIRSLDSKLFQEISVLIENSKKNVITTINREMVILYWKVGNIINSDVTRNNRADYGKKVIKELSKQLTLHYGKGFSETTLRNAIKFAQVYPSLQISHTLCEKLSWSHIRELIYIDDELKREFYIELCTYERWSVRVLLERIDSMLFERTAISKKPEQTIKGDLVKLKENKELSPALTFRDPYVLDFLDLHDSYSEKDLENAILRRMKEFLVEIGSDFAFMGQQKRITIDNEDLYIDLLFYHRTWRRLVVIDLKLGKFKAAYKGQMELYLRWLEKYEMREGENKPIGLILCAEKKTEQVELMTLDDEQIEVAEYKTQIPDRRLFKDTLHHAIIEARKELGDIDGMKVIRGCGEI
jgi:predicted nuclease of restriction endonuclease-like (RecB) superfamily